jgi:hypothetical protein
VYCIMPIHQEKKWETWELRRLLLGKANPKKKEDCPTDGMWDSLALNVLPLFLFFFCSISSCLLCSPLLSHLGEGGARKFLYRLFCMCVCVCAIVVYPRAAEHRRAV